MDDFPFSEYLFWDSNIADIDIKKNKRYIIERVLTRGQLTDFKAMLNVYATSEIIESILKSKHHISHLTIQFEHHWCDDKNMIHH